MSIWESWSMTKPRGPTSASTTTGAWRVEVPEEAWSEACLVMTMRGLDRRHGGDSSLDVAT